MTLFNYNLNPAYPDRYSRDKKWVKILPVSGRHLQTAELTEIQSILQDNLKQGFDTLFKSGTPLSGLKMGVSQVGNGGVTISISAGQIYIEGVIVDVEETTIIMPAQGEFTIGVLIEEVIKTEIEDPDLRDPLRGGDLYGPAGASRLVWRSSIVLAEDNPDAFVIGKVIDAIPIQKQVNPFYQVERILSQYTYERSGHFCVSGFEVTSLGTNKRAVSDQTKYTALQTALTNASSEQQTVLTNALTAQSRITNFNVQLQAAIQQSILSPTPTNLAKVDDLRARLELATQTFNSLSNLLVNKEQALLAAQSSIIKSEGLLVDKELFSISPGIAYVEGYRVNKPDPSLVIIPKDLPETIVDAARFNYSGTPARTLREFTLSTGTDILNAPGESVTVKLIFSGLPNNTGLVSLTTSTFKVVVQVVVSAANLNLTRLLENIVSELNYTSTPGTDFTYQLKDGNNVALVSSPEIIRAFLKTHVITVLQGTTSILFSSTNLNEIANSINLEVDIQRTVLGEITQPVLQVDVPKANLAGGENISTFQLGFRPVAQVIKLIADVEEVFKPLIRGGSVDGAPGTSDKLGDDSIIRISNVIQGNPNSGIVNTYVEGVDYRLINQSEIDWSLPGAEPLPGTTYFVSFVYTQPFAINQDFVLDDATDCIKFTGRTPAIGGVFTIDYSYYLAKSGVITLDKDGVFSYVLSSASQEPIPPAIADNLLGLASFTLYADRTLVKALPCRRQTVEDLYQLADRVHTNAKNAEILRLDLEGIRRAFASSSSPPVGSYNDSIQDLSKVDLEASNGAVIPAIQAYTAGFQRLDIPLRYVLGGKVHANDFGEDTFITLPYVSTPLLAQPKATTWRDITPYTSGIKRRGRLNVSHPLIFLNDNDHTEVTPCDALSKVANALSVQSSSSPVIRTIISSVNNLLGPIGEKVAQSIANGTAISVATSDTSSFVDSIYSKVTVAPSTYIKLKAEDLTPSSEGYRLFFSGKEVKQFTLLASTGNSINPPGSIKAKSDGTIHLSFLIPPDTLCGVHSIELISDNGYAKNRISLYNNILSQVTLSALRTWGAIPLTTAATNTLATDYSDYLSEDLLKLGIDSNIYPDGIANLITQELAVGHLYPLRHKPLTQTFESPDQAYLTKVLLKLRSGPTTNTGDLNLYIRTASDLPERTTLAKANTNNYAYTAFGDEFTEFTLREPILLNRHSKYSLCLDSRIPGYKVYTSEIGKRDIENNTFIGQQLYLEGDLYTTKDGIALTQFDREDLTYELQRAEFTSDSKIIDLGKYGSDDLFNDVTGFCINTRDTVPIGTEIVYEYSACETASNCGGWIQFKPNTVVCTSTVMDSVFLRATMITNSPRLSPSLLLAGASITLYSALANNEMISKRVTYPNTYREVNISIEYVQPQGTDIEVYYSPTRGYAWENPEWIKLSLDSTSITLIDPTLSLYRATYTKTEPSDYYVLSEPRHNFRFRIKTSTPNKALQPLIKNVITFVNS